MMMVPLWIPNGLIVLRSDYIVIKLKKILPLIISGGLLFYLFYHLDGRQIYTALQDCNFKLILIASVVTVIVKVQVGAVKWRQILSASGSNLSLGEVLMVRSGCMPLKLLFPMKSSEFFKAYYLQHQHQMPLSSGLRTLIFEKSLNLLVMLVLWLGVLIPGLTLSAGLILISLKSIRAAISGSMLAIIYSFIYLLSDFLTPYLIFMAVGVPIPWTALLVYIPVTTFLNYLPISVMGLGTREAMLVYFFNAFGPSAALFGAALLVSLCEQILPVLVGFFF